MLYEEEDHPGLYEKEYYHHQACGHSDHPSTGYIQLSSSKDSFGTFDNGSMQPYKFSCHKKLLIVNVVISCDVSPVAMFAGETSEVSLILISGEELKSHYYI